MLFADTKQIEWIEGGARKTGIELAVARGHQGEILEVIEPGESIVVPSTPLLPSVIAKGKTGRLRLLPCAAVSERPARKAG